MMDKSKVQRIMQYALFVAGRADDLFERSLSPIHLIKYLYLVDLEFAKHNEGVTFTGVDWMFHHFGPWSVNAFQQIDVALAAIDATKTSVQSAYGEKDFIRWSVDPNQVRISDIKRDLPLEVRLNVEHYVGKFHNNTSAMLHFVYSTQPMLNAAPGDLLNFSVAVAAKRGKDEPYVPFFKRLPPKQQKALVVGMAELRTRFTQKVAKSRGHVRCAQECADTVFEEGMAWLDGLAGGDFPEKGATVHFSDEVWKSKARSGNAGIS